MNIKVNAAQLKNVLDYCKFIPRSVLAENGFVKITGELDRAIPQKDVAIIDVAGNYIQAQFKINAWVGETGECCISIEKLLRFASYERFNIEIIANKNVMLSGSGVTQVMENKRDIYQYGFQMPENQYQVGNDFMLYLKQALPFSASEESRPVLFGVEVKTDKEGNTDIVAADGFRLIVISTKTQLPEGSFIIPRNVLAFITKIFEGQVITVGLDKNRITFSREGFHVAASLISGTFPKYEQLIPTATPAWTFKVLPAQLKEKALQMQYSDGTGIFRFRSQDGKLELRATEYDDYEIKATIPADMTGEGKIAINNKYVVDWCEVFPEKPITVSVTTPSAPALVTGDLGNIKIVTMPMFIQW